mgnify:FL=1
MKNAEKERKEYLYNNPFDNMDYDFESPDQYFVQRTGGQMAPGGGRPNQPGWMPPSWGAPPNQPGRPMPFPGGGPGQSPMGPPPRFIPTAPMTQSFAGGINRCLFRNTYIWIRNGRSFWFFPTSISRNMIFGFRWSNRNGWVPRTIQRDNILTFTCSFF